MESISILQWLIVTVYVVGMIVPFWTILSREGLRRVLSLIMPIFPINLLELRVLALKSWPGDPQAVRS